MIEKDKILNCGVLILAVMLIFSACENSVAIPTATTTTQPTMPESSKYDLGIEKSTLDSLMQPIFAGNAVEKETVMFLEAGEAKQLLYPISQVQSVTSYDGKTVYENGKDYIVDRGQLILTKDSRIPCITKETYYGASSSSLLQTEYNGQTVYTHWGEGRLMTDWQVCVTYTHESSWDGFRQNCEIEHLMPFVEKLKNHQDVTVFFYGDSITYGANASYISNYEPFQASYPMLFVQSLADLFGYRVEYVNTELADTSKVPQEPYVAGSNGTITYINTAVGGWSSKDAALQMDQYVGSILERYGCDLFVIGVGMNDGTFNPSLTAKHVKMVCDLVLENHKDAAMLLVSTMVPNPNAVNGWYGNQPLQEKKLQQLAEEYRENGISCSVACMTSVSLDVLKYKDFHDYSGNNINHPNDFFARVYAQTLLQTVIGYENMK